MKLQIPMSYKFLLNIVWYSCIIQVADNPEEGNPGSDGNIPFEQEGGFMNPQLTLTPTATVAADPRMCNPSVKALWRSFSLGKGELAVNPGPECTFRLGETDLPALPEGKEYALRVDEKGAAIVGKDYGGLMRGFMSLLMKIEHSENAFRIQSVEECSDYYIQNRFLHICVFPENDLYFIKKLVRLAALCQYTHIVIEFWGMLQYDCMKELAWPQAFTKDQARELIRECRDLGIEPVPMFNQLGHATASRNCYGKHVVLDQNPALEHLFTPDGWAWNIASAPVLDLLKQVRAELYDLFGECQFMHIGCDEAYYITNNAPLRKLLPDYLAALTAAVEAEGRRPMLWMDMLLEAGKFPDCYSSGKPEEVEAIRNATAPSSVFVDWQYWCTLNPIPSLVSLKDCGRDCIGAPWSHPDNYAAHIDTITRNDLFGIMLTTWHTLRDHMPTIADCAMKCGAKTFPWSSSSGKNEITATMLRRVCFEGNTYESSGWSKRQIEV